MLPSQERQERILFLMRFLELGHAELRQFFGAADIHAYREKARAELASLVRAEFEDA